MTESDVSDKPQEDSVKKTILIAALAASAMGTQVANAARDYISIVGSSTVYPFSTVVAERFGKSSRYKTPKIEATGTGGGMKLFCDGLGVANPDITNASRRMKKSEFDMCQENGVNNIVEVLIGYDGIVVGNSAHAEQINLSRRDLYLALAAEVPNPNGSETLVKNPYRTWKDVNPALPAKPGRQRAPGRQPLQALATGQPGVAQHRHRGAGPATHLWYS